MRIATAEIGWWGAESISGLLNLQIYGRDVWKYIELTFAGQTLAGQIIANQTLTGQSIAIQTRAGQTSKVRKRLLYLYPSLAHEIVPLSISSLDIFSSLPEHRVDCAPGHLDDRHQMPPSTRISDYIGTIPAETEAETGFPHSTLVVIPTCQQSSLGQKMSMLSLCSITIAPSHAAAQNQEFQHLVYYYDDYDKSKSILYPKADGGVYHNANHLKPSNSLSRNVPPLRITAIIQDAHRSLSRLLSFQPPITPNPATAHDFSAEFSSSATYAYFECARILAP